MISTKAELHSSFLLQLSLTLAVVGLTGCSKRQTTPTIASDGWWDVDYAKPACECAAGLPASWGVIPCTEDGPTMARRLERDFLSAFQTNRECSGVSIVNDFHDLSDA